ncbi:flagellar motor protein MotB [Helicobacter sp. MIT 99-5507]|uniref:flagellar motor protein MotB n=1 Tax=Helicobacter sp. MIT 99-5507 TaxID=152489 RepID=UPI000E1F032B|nr:flagellar motor protein MotB [Helicobacter sp. MIT 99-5507]RDU58142.1 flagellar motor protein MotB [Helicobacter sp. MIT 99-5507]
MAKKINIQNKSGGGLPLWLGTFGDLMSLLLTFFILLLSMATFDAKKLVEAEASIKGALSILEGGIKIEPSKNRITLPADMVVPPEYAEEVRVLQQTIIDFNDMQNISKGQADMVGDGLNGFIITLPSNIIFDENFKINEDAKLLLKRISQILEKLPQNTQVEVLGISNISTTSINLERASKMALSVGRELYNLNINGNRINIIGIEDKNLPKNEDLLNIRFYAKEIQVNTTKGLLDK